MVTVSIVGCGHMGTAIINGLAESDAHEIIAYDHTPESLEEVAPYCETTTTDPQEAATAEVIMIAVKPEDMADVLGTFDLDSDQTLVSVAAGVPLAFVQQYTDATVVRVMPNLAAETQTMAAAVAWDQPDDAVTAILDDLGEFVEIDESLMHAATALNGSGPAFVFYLIKALRDAGVAEGLSAQQAEQLSAQTFKGAAETVLHADASLEELIDAVCSPNGTTIEGMEVLWESDVDTSIADALTAAADRSRALARDQS